MKPVYSIKDLDSRELLDAGADKPARLAVLGWPVAHSASPVMHQAALDAAGHALRYIRLEIEPGGIPEAFARMRELGFIGCNVTVPHKLAALAACGEVDPEALALGAVNTVRFDTDQTRGFNTDGPGFARAVEDEFGVPLAGLKVLIAGAGGGAGQAIAAQCVRMGVEKLVLTNRTLDKLDPLVTRLNAMGGRTNITALALDSAALAAEAASCGLVVNTSSLGLKAGDAPVIGSDCLVSKPFVYDTIYQPPVTPLIALAAAAGCRTANGLSMLLHQGALAYLQWFPGGNPLPEMRAALAGLGR